MNLRRAVENDRDGDPPAVPNWIAAPVTMTLVTGLSNAVSLTFLANNAVNVNANFVAAPVEISVGAFSSRLRMADGTMREWGLDVVSNGIFNAVQARPGVNDAVQIAGGGANSSSTAACARRATGDIVCWGVGNLLGVPPGTRTSTPVMLALPFGTPYSQLSIGAGHACAMEFDAVMCWIRRWCSPPSPPPSRFNNDVDDVQAAGR